MEAKLNRYFVLEDKGTILISTQTNIRLQLNSLSSLTLTNAHTIKTLVIPKLILNIEIIKIKIKHILEDMRIAMLAICSCGLNHELGQMVKIDWAMKRIEVEKDNEPLVWKTDYIDIRLLRSKYEIVAQ
jgi:hypothetical protein